MLALIAKNRLYFSLYFVFFMLVFLLTFNSEKLTATLFFSEHRSVFGDLFFKYWTRLGEAYPFLFVVVFSVIQKQPRLAWKAVIAGLVALVVSGLLKDFFAINRPIIEIEQQNLTALFTYVSGVDLLRGASSFPSGHTSAAFALWSLLAFQFSKYPRLQIVCFLTAFFVGVSRVYLVQHFPPDTLLGSAIGLATALCVEYFFEKKSVPNASKQTKIVALPTEYPPSV
jgi:membrane-associated phospholipid phosphatase